MGLTIINKIINQKGYWRLKIVIYERIYVELKGTKKLKVYKNAIDYLLYRWDNIGIKFLGVKHEKFLFS